MRICITCVIRRQLVKSWLSIRHNVLIPRCNIASQCCMYAQNRTHVYKRQGTRDNCHCTYWRFSLHPGMHRLFDTVYRTLTAFVCLIVLKHFALNITFVAGSICHPYLETDMAVSNCSSNDSVRYNLIYRNNLHPYRVGGNIKLRD